ncbi:hypothetical protein [Cyanobium sp. LEGE 06113]|uniref:hypothetical protein n=1 Tax=Cyanobium sp. LEGE 06113 TaxID=1297573 RepID=UPI001646A776|nr:hypothetical protein [Cyanobium sp. LEGE 06113]MBE9153872.1 hypothetical protein [Cyanobium sp. LEGE 06113]
MVASFVPRQASTRQPLEGPTSVFPAPATRATGNRRAVDGAPLQLIQGSLSGQKVARRAPWLAGLHRVADGALVGLGLCMLGLSGLTLHWQNHWGQSYQALEAAQVLEHRLQESAALLEQHHLSAVGKPGRLVPTASHQLIHLPMAKGQPPHPAEPLLSSLEIRRIPAGY